MQHLDWALRDTATGRQKQRQAAATRPVQEAVQENFCLSQECPQLLRSRGVSSSEWQMAQEAAKSIAASAAAAAPPPPGAPSWASIGQVLHSFNPLWFPSLKFTPLRHTVV